MNMLVPLEIGLEVQRGEAAYRRALLAEAVDAGGQRDLAAQVRGLDLQAGELLVLGQVLVHVVDEDDVGLAGLDARLQDADPQAAGRDLAQRRAVLGRGQRPLLVGLDRAHEGVGDEDAVVQVERLAVGVAAIGAPDLDELLDLGMADRDIDRRRAAAQRALRDRERERIHDADERHDARRLAVHADLLADRAEIAPVGADAAAARRQPDVLVPQPDDAFERIRGLVQEAGDWQSAAGPPIAQHRRGRHEPQIADVVVEPLGMAIVVGIGRGNPGEHLLVTLVGQEVAVGKCGLAEGRQPGVPRGIGHNPRTASNLNDIKHLRPPSSFLSTAVDETPCGKTPTSWEELREPHYPLMIRPPNAVSSPNFYLACESEE
jgi:hypothetical protein